MATVDGYTKIKNSFLRDPELDPYKKIILQYIASFLSKKGAAWPSQYRMERELGISRRHVSRCLKWLEQHGYIESKFLPGESKLYWLDHETPDLVGPGVRLEVEDD